MKGPELEITIQEFRRKQKRARVGFFLVMIAVLGFTIAILGRLSWLSQRAQAEADARRSELKRLADEAHLRGDMRTDRKLDRAEIFQSLPGESQKKVIGIAIDLYEEKPPIPYTWGGKVPDKGFDSSGYVAYSLKEAGLDYNPAADDSRLLRQKMKSIPVEEKRPGDLLFFEGGACLFYLGGRDNLAIGALPGGIATGNTDYLNMKAVAVGRY